MPFCLLLPSPARKVAPSCRHARGCGARDCRAGSSARRRFPLLLPFSLPPRPVRPRPGRHVAAAAGAAAAAHGACTARSSVPRTRTLASGCSLHQVTRRGSEVGQALPQRRSLVLRPAPLTGPGGAGPSLGQDDGCVSPRAGCTQQPRDLPQPWCAKDVLRHSLYTRPRRIAPFSSPGTLTVSCTASLPFIFVCR